MIDDWTLVVSNNPAVWEAFPSCIRVAGSPLHLMRKVRDLVHGGHRLKGHPLAGSIRLLRNPYRTVVLGRRDASADSEDVLRVEEALSRLSHLEFSMTPESTLSDYRWVDLTLVEAFLGDGILHGARLLRR